MFTQQEYLTIYRRWPFLAIAYLLPNRNKKTSINVGFVSSSGFSFTIMPLQVFNHLRMIIFQVYISIMVCHYSNKSIICGTLAPACARYRLTCCYQSHSQFHLRLNHFFHCQCLLTTLVSRNCRWGDCNKAVFGMTCSLQWKEKTGGIQMLWKDRVQGEMHLVEDEANTSMVQKYLLAVVAAYDDMNYDYQRD